jgi:hypothetical protein
MPMGNKSAGSAFELNSYAGTLCDRRAKPGMETGLSECSADGLQNGVESRIIRKIFALK